jgi:hypothetical protein
MSDTGNENGSPKSVVITFPREKSDRLKKRGDARDLGLTELSKALGPQARGAKGRWCESCQGIWYSYLHETRCPVCNTRA